MSDPSDPADQIIAALNDSVDDCPRCKVCDHQDDAIRAVVATVLAERDAKIERLRSRVAELQPLEVGIKSLTTADGSIDMSLHMAHDMMRIYVAAFREILDREGGPNWCEMTWKLAGSLDRYTLTIRQPNGKSPAEVASEQRQRAEQAEAAIARAKARHRTPAERDEPNHPLCACGLHSPCPTRRALDQPGDQPKEPT